MPPTREQQQQDDFLDHTITMLMRWLPSRKGRGEEKLFLRRYEGRVVKSWVPKLGF